MNKLLMGVAASAIMTNSAVFAENIKDKPIMSKRPNIILINCDDLGYGDIC